MEWIGHLFSAVARNLTIAVLQQLFGSKKKAASLRVRRGQKAGTSIEGTMEDLNAISEALEEVAQGRSRKAKFHAVIDGNPAPYDTFLQGLQIELRLGLLHMEITPKHWLLISGNEKGLRIAKSCFAFPGNSPWCSHTHLEWYDGNPYIEQDAEPLVISVVSTDAQTDP